MSYKIHGKWSLDRTDEVDGVTVTTMVTDLIDNRGTVFTDGAYQVRKAGKVVKTFKGEFAWADAARLHGDLVTELRYR